jgi:hypothetical protein
MSELSPEGPALREPRARLLPTIVVAAIIALVVPGGMGLDAAIAAPSAGTLTVGGSVTITAAPGWVLVPPGGDAVGGGASGGGASGGIQLQKANAILVAQLVSSGYSGDSASMLVEQQASLAGDSAQISYSDIHHTSIGDNDTTFVLFEAVVASGDRSGIVDGELVCMVVEGNAVVVVVAASQGDLEPVIDDVSAMLVSVGVRR